MRNERQEVRKNIKTIDIQLVGIPSPEFPAAIQISSITDTHAESAHTYPDIVETVNAVTSAQRRGRWGYANVSLFYGSALIKAAELIDNSPFLPIPREYRLSLPAWADALIDIALITGSIVGGKNLFEKVTSNLKWLKRVDQKLRSTKMEFDRVDVTRLNP